MQITVVLAIECQPNLCSILHDTTFAIFTERCVLKKFQKQQITTAATNLYFENTLPSYR